MIHRKKLNKLVVNTLEVHTTNPRASILYAELVKINPQIFREEKVRGFKSFVKIINSFPNIATEGIGIKRYYVKDSE